MINGSTYSKAITTPSSPEFDSFIFCEFSENFNLKIFSKNCKIFTMPSNHTIIQPEILNEEIIGFTNIHIQDQNECLNLHLYEDIQHFLEDVTPFLVAPENIPPIDNRNVNDPVGMAVPQTELRRLQNMIAENGYSAGAHNTIRNVLSCTANIHNTNFPGFNMCTIKVVIVCDYIRGA